MTEEEKTRWLPRLVEIPWHKRDLIFAGYNKGAANNAATGLEAPTEHLFVML
jgi:hypothetical protein